MLYSIILILFTYYSSLLTHYSFTTHSLLFTHSLGLATRKVMNFQQINQALNISTFAKKDPIDKKLCLSKPKLKTEIVRLNSA